MLPNRLYHEFARKRHTLVLVVFEDRELGRVTATEHFSVVLLHVRVIPVRVNIPPSIPLLRAVPSVHSRVLLVYRREPLAHRDYAVVGVLLRHVLVSELGPRVVVPEIVECFERDGKYEDQVSVGCVAGWKGDICKQSLHFCF